MGKAGKHRPAAEAQFVAAGFFHFTGKDWRGIGSDWNIGHLSDSQQRVLDSLLSIASRIPIRDARVLRDAFDGVDQNGHSLREDS